MSGRVMESIVQRPGLSQLVARFAAVRQALALMDHPNIARVLDAGTTDQDRPYFVMELVRGLPITEYCDRNQLSIPERLELFVLICRAVDSLTPLYGSAAFMERECHDMYGIVFRGNPDLRPILLYEGFDGHPLRKDYPKEHEQPLVPYRSRD